MKAKRDGQSPKGRLKTGAAVLAAAQVTDVTVIQPRMTGFANTHSDYVAAQHTVEMAETDLRKGRAELNRCRAAQHAAVEGVAAMLVADGAPRANPFALFDTGTPFAITQLAAAAQAMTIRVLVDTILDSTTVSTATCRAARTTEQAVGAVEEALLTLGKLQAALRLARATRTEVGQAWNTALAALKRGARWAADEGAPGLYEALFGGLRRPRRKNTKAAAATQAAPAAADPV